LILVGSERQSLEALEVFEILDADLLAKLERLQIDLVIRELANFVAVLAARVQIFRRLSPHILILVNLDERLDSCFHV